MKKYELTNEAIKTLDGTTIYRIKALKDFGDVKAGDLGGFIEKESNLSHEGECWISGKVQVFGNAKIFGEAKVLENAQVFGEAEIFGKARVSEKAKVSEKAQIFGNAEIFGGAQVFGKAKVLGETRVFGKSKIYGEAIVFENAEVADKAKVHGKARLYGRTILRGVDNISKSGGFITITGFTYDITLTKTSIHVGCRDFTLDDLDKDHNKLDTKEVNKIKAIIKAWYS